MSLPSSGGESSAAAVGCSGQIAHGTVSIAHRRVVAGFPKTVCVARLPERNTLHLLRPGPSEELSKHKKKCRVSKYLWNI